MPGVSRLFVIGGDICMKWRVIVRMSFNNDKGSRLRYRVEQCLAACGIKRSRMTATWEGNAVSALEASKQFETVFKLLADPTKIAGPRPARLDHLWIYIDRAKNPEINPPVV
jgi:hypothetical protein